MRREGQFYFLGPQGISNYLKGYPGCFTNTNNSKSLKTNMCLNQILSREKL